MKKVFGLIIIVFFVYLNTEKTNSQTVFSAKYNKITIQDTCYVQVDLLAKFAETNANAFRFIMFINSDANLSLVTQDLIMTGLDNKKWVKDIFKINADKNNINSIYYFWNTADQFLPKSDKPDTLIKLILKIPIKNLTQNKITISLNKFFVFTKHEFNYSVVPIDGCDSKIDILVP